MADKLNEMIAMVKNVSEADRLAKMARVKNPRSKGSMAGDVTTGLGRSKKDMEKIARGGAKEMKYGGKVKGYESGGSVGGMCRGGRSALRGTKFNGVK